MEEVLRSLGVTHVFEPDGADFSGMSSQRELLLSKVMRRSFVEANEEGTVAVATTGATSCCLHARASVLTASPFPLLCALHSEPVVGILLCGRFASP